MAAWSNGSVDDGSMSSNNSGVLKQSDVYSLNPLDSFCGSPLWSYHLTIATDHPDVTSCFQATILVWIPCGFLLVSSLPYIFYLSQKKPDKIPHSLLNISKSILGVCLAILATAQLVIYSLNKQNGAYILAAILRIMAMVFVVALVQLERHRGRRTSSILSLYWFLTCISSVIILHSAVRGRMYLTDVPSFIILCCYHACAAVQLILSLLVDKWSYNMKGRCKENLCPYYEASVLSRLTFSWTFSMMLKGYRKSLEEDDLWDLRDDINCQTVVQPLLSRWNRKMLRRIRAKEMAKKPVPDSEIPLTSLEEGVKVSPPTGRYEPSFFFTVLRAYWFSYFILILLRATQEVLLFSKPQVLKLLLGFVRDHTEFSWRGYMYAILMFLLSVSECLVGQHLNYVHQLTGTKIRVAIMSMVYRKALKLSHAARAESTVGEIVNLMSVDAHRFMELAWLINMVWAAPVQVALALYFLYDMLGPAIFAGLGVMILIFPINAVIVKINKKLHVKHMKQKDARMKMMNEILSGIKVLKLYAWELSFEKKIHQIRHKELSTRKMSILVHCCAMLLWSCSPFLVALASFGTYTLIYPTSQLDAQKIFVSLALLNLLKVPLKELPGLISHMVQLYVSVQRLSRYLKHEEMDPDAVSRDTNTDQTIVIENGSFGWNKRDPPLLKNIDLNIKEGSLVAVVGVVGAGKSSLLSAILGEMERFTGRVNVKGTVAYVAQQAWIQQDTLKNNILFHNPERSSDYTQLINHCALQPDLDILPAGDATEIGEKGINLSGGQKLRVSLARAVYHEADIYIMDDPLSAVDAHVGKHIFQNVIGPNGMLKNKTRIMVTHSISFLPKVDQIVVIVDGRISETGSYRELLNRGGAFAEFLENYLLEHEEEAMETVDTEEAEVRQEILSRLSSEPSDDREKRILLRQMSLQNGVTKGPEPRGRSLTWGTSANRYLNFSKIEPRKTKSQHALVSSESRLHSDVQGIPPFEFDINEEEQLTEGDVEESIPEKEESREDTRGKEKRKKNLKDKGRLIEEERAEKGKVKLAVYTTYLKAIGIPIGVLLLLIGGGHVALDLGSSVWLSAWSDDALRTPQNGTIDTALRSKRLAVYTILGLTQGIMAALQEFVGMIAGLRTSRIQHERLLRNILSCPMSFFDRTPVGRLLNRFGKDVDTMDGRLPRLLLPLTRRGFHILGSLIIISTVTPWILLVCAGLSVFYLIIQRLYVTSQRQLNRILSNNRSPIYANFSETLTGVSTIRAYRREDLFVEDSMERLNRLVRSHYPIMVNNRWLGIVLQSMGAIIVLVAATFAVAGRYTLTPGTVGLAITYALTITGTFNWMVRTTGQVETQIVAVERVKEYCDVPTEAAWDMPETRPDEDWPDAGKVEFRRLSLRYREGLDLVLKDVDFHVKPSEKVGIVGRTGAGKSSLTLSLFRLLEAADGAIYIDGVNIADIGLHDLRSKLTIIPQDPVLFSGTLRMNLDPFGRHMDDESGQLSSTLIWISSCFWTVFCNYVVYFQDPVLFSGTLRMNLDPFERHTDDEIWTALQHSHLDQFVFLTVFCNYVVYFQDPVLFSGTLRMNLDPFERHTDDEIWTALQHSHLDQFVSSLPDKLLQECFEGGSNLSVGQRQLVCLARALLRKSKVLVLDEATAAVDLETDDFIQSTIRTEFKECTVLTIAHRLNTILDCDRVMVLDRGKVKELDAPRSLISDKATIFYKMAKDAGLAE